MRNTARLRRFKHAIDWQAIVPDHRQCDAEEDGHQQDLQDVAAREGGQERRGKDAHQEADDSLVMRMRRVFCHCGRIERRGIDLQRGPHFQSIGDHQTQDQREGRKEQEIGEGLERDPADRPQIPYPRDTCNHRKEDDRCDDHLDDSNEGIAKRLEGLAEIRAQIADQGAQRDRDQDLDVEMAPDRDDLGIGLAQSACCSHAVSSPLGRLGSSGASNRAEASAARHPSDRKQHGPKLLYFSFI